jgi:hypothetical protein
LWISGGIGGKQVMRQCFIVILNRNKGYLSYNLLKKLGVTGLHCQMIVDHYQSLSVLHHCQFSLECPRLKKLQVLMVYLSNLSEILSQHAAYYGCVCLRNNLRLFFQSALLGLIPKPISK